MSRIGLIGCGWLGKPLAKSLSTAHQVQCFSRKEDNAPDLDYVINPKADHPFWKNEIFIIAISTRDDYLNTLEEIAQKCSPSASLILMSSTSVYKEFEGDVDETAGITQTSIQVQAEALMLSLRKKLLVLRLGGLMGEDRIAGRWKSASSFTDGPVNYIHQDDVIAIVQKMIGKNITEGIYNLVAPKHPLRSEVHLNNSKAFGFEPGRFTKETPLGRFAKETPLGRFAKETPVGRFAKETPVGRFAKETPVGRFAKETPVGRFEGTSRRVVSSAKLIQELDYTFIHPDPLQFWTSL